MSTVDEFVRARSAFDKPTLTLLKRKWAPVVVAVFTTLFTREQPRISADRFHARVQDALDDLHLHGAETPDGTARDVCNDWVRQKWLIRATSDDAREEYALTSHAQEALDYVARLSAERTAMFGESRVKTILDTARRVAMDANPDRDRRVALLSEQIEELTRERDRIASGGTVVTASDEQMIDAFLNLQGLLEELPRDFLRVTESVKDIHREILADFRAEDRRTGEVLDTYLDRADTLMTGSASGRAFTGAVALLRSEDMLSQLRQDIDAILSHEFAASLTSAEVTGLRRTASAINSMIDVVLQERRRLSGTLQTHITRHDPLRDRELDEALRVVSAELQTWVANNHTKAKVPLQLELNRVETAHLRTRLYDPSEHAPPPPLVEAEIDDGDDDPFGAISSQGGPALGALSEWITAAVEAGKPVNAADVFAALPADLRRPVDVLGMIHLGATGSARDDDTNLAEFETVRPDGTVEVLTAPAQVFTPPTSTPPPNTAPSNTAPEMAEPAASAAVTAKTEEPR